MCTFDIWSSIRIGLVSIEPRHRVYSRNAQLGSEGLQSRLQRFPGWVGLRNGRSRDSCVVAHATRDLWDRNSSHFGLGLHGDLVRAGPSSVDKLIMELCDFISGRGPDFR